MAKDRDNKKLAEIAPPACSSCPATQCGCLHDSPLMHGQALGMAENNDAGSTINTANEGGAAH